MHERGIELDMKVLSIVVPMLHYYPDLPSGSTRLAYDEATFLARLGHSVWVVTQDVPGKRAEHTFEDGLHILCYPPPKMGALDPRRSFVHQSRTRDLLVRHVGPDVDVLHGHSLLQYRGALALYAARARTCYSVHSPVYLEMRAAARGVPVWRRLRLLGSGCVAHRIEHECIMGSTSVTAESDYTRSLISQLHGTRAQRKVSVIPGWVDLERFRIARDRQVLKRQLKWPLETQVFFTLRRLVPRMGVDNLLRAFHKVRAAGHGFHLIIGGDGPLRPHLESLAHELGIAHEVCFIGRVPQSALPLMYAACDAFVLPTAELECFGLIILEALACGRPVLATPVGAIPEVLSPIERQWLARDASEDAIADLILAFMRSGLPRHSPEAVRNRVATNYSRELVLRRLVDKALGTTANQYSPSQSRDLWGIL